MKPDQEALDYIDHFIASGRQLAELEIFSEPTFRPAASALCDVAQTLMASNGHMADWLNRFRYFNFQQEGARGAFMDLLKEYDTTQQSGGFHAMKYPCGEIWTIYQEQIEAKIDALPPENDELADEVREAFNELSGGDVDMVAFIHHTVLALIDGFRGDAEPGLSRSDINAAETARLRFTGASQDLSLRLVRFAGELSDLSLAYAQIARRPVILDVPGGG